MTRARSPPERVAAGCAARSAPSPTRAEHGGHGRVEVGHAQARPALERVGVTVVGVGVAGREGPHGGVELPLGHLCTGPPADDVGDGLARLDLQLLGEVADPSVARDPGHGARLGIEVADQQPQQGRLAHAVGADDADAVAGRDGEGDVGEHDVGAVGEREIVGDDLRGHQGSRSRDKIVHEHGRSSPENGSGLELLLVGDAEEAGPARPARMPRLRPKAARSQAMPPMIHDTDGATEQGAGGLGVGDAGSAAG